MSSDNNNRNAAVLSRSVLRELSSIVGAEQLLSDGSDTATYRDLFALDDGSAHAPSAVVRPADVEQVRAVLRVANRHGIPVWPVSRGQNLGYGGAAPVLKGSVTLDLSRMNRILEVDEKTGYCLVEPGVGFFELWQYLQDNKINLWLSVPGYAAGSVMGNALERGVGPQPYGEHSDQICGLEVILADGEVVRTGTGAMGNSRTWPQAKHGFGPGWDSMFCQSNFGVVTKLGLWLMPAPEATLSTVLSFPEADDIGRGTELLHGLRREDLLDTDVALISYVGLASYIDARSRWYNGTGLLPETVGAQIRAELGLGWWMSFVTLYGHASVIDAKASLIRQRVMAAGLPEPTFTPWKQGEPLDRSGAGIPRTNDLKMIGWHGGRGGHLGFSPLLPADAAVATEQFKRTRSRFEEFGLDYYGAFGIGKRKIVNVNELLYDRDNAQMVRNVDRCFRALVSDAAAAGFGEYRTHIDYMDLVAETFDFSNHALRRLNQRVKDALDPNGILAPGKQGIWPARYR